MITIRLLAFIIGILSLYTTHLNFKRKVFNSFELLIWSTVWACLLLIAIAPHAVYAFLGSIGGGYISDLLMIIAFVVIYSIGFYSYILFRKQQQALEQVVRELAILTRNMGEAEQSVAATKSRSLQG